MKIFRQIFSVYSQNYLPPSCGLRGMELSHFIPLGSFLSDFSKIQCLGYTDRKLEIRKLRKAKQNLQPSSTFSNTNSYFSIDTQLLLPHIPALVDPRSVCSCMISANASCSWILDQVVIVIFLSPTSISVSLLTQIHHLRTLLFLYNYHHILFHLY